MSVATECSHSDGYGSTVVDGGLCLLCDRTVRESPWPRRFRDLTVFCFLLGLGALVGAPYLAAAFWVGICYRDFVR